MLRYWPLFFIALIVATVVGVSQYYENAKQRCEDSARQTEAATVAKNGDKETSKNAENACRPHGWARYFTWPEGVGAWAVILTLLAIAWQSIATERAAESGKRSADAALLNAQAVINSERAWLTVKIDDGVSPLPDLAPSHFQNERRQLQRILAKMEASVEFGDEEDNGMCYVIIQNKGRTPAKVIGGSFSHCFVDRLSNLPVPPDYSSPFFMPDPAFIVSDGNFRIHPGFKPELILKRNGNQEAIDIAMGFLVFFGRVVYEDVFSLPDGTKGTHETRWCFMCRTGDPRPFMSGGPAEYNGYT